MPKEQPKQPFLFEEMQPQEEQMPAFEGEGDIELVRERSNERVVLVNDKVFSRIFKFVLSDNQVVLASTEGDDIQYARGKELEKRAKGLAEKILLSSWAQKKRMQGNLYKEN